MNEMCSEGVLKYSEGVLEIFRGCMNGKYSEGVLPPSARWSRSMRWVLLCPRVPIGEVNEPRPVRMGLWRGWDESGARVR